jgi:hypothetical protein
MMQGPFTQVASVNKKGGNHGYSSILDYRIDYRLLLWRMLINNTQHAIKKNIIEQF